MVILTAWLTTREAADLVGVTMMHITSRIADGSLRARKIPAKNGRWDFQVIVYRLDVEAWAERRANGTRRPRKPRFTA